MMQNEEDAFATRLLLQATSHSNLSFSKQKSKIVDAVTHESDYHSGKQIRGEGKDQLVITRDS